MGARVKKRKKEVEKTRQEETAIRVKYKIQKMILGVLWDGGN